MPFSVKILRGLDELDPKVKVVILDLLEEIEENTRETVKRSDFDELKAAFTELTRTVNELAQAQKKSEERLTRLEAAVENLAEAQKRTEQRVEELAQAQKRTEQRVEELAEAQKKSEKRLTELDIAIKELAEAQKRTEEKFRELAEVQRVTIERLEVLSNSVVYSLENNAYKGLPILLEKEGIKVEGKLIRRYYEENQINVWGYGRKNGEIILILGEVKVRPSKKEIDKFLRLTDKITKKENKDIYTVFIAHDYHSNIEKYLNEKGIKYYWSYELE